MTLALYLQNVCHTLWCSVGRTCHSKLDATVDGSSCGDNKVQVPQPSCAGGNRGPDFLSSVHAQGSAPALSIPDPRLQIGGMGLDSVRLPSVFSSESAPGLFHSLLCSPVGPGPWVTGRGPPPLL